MTYRAGPPAKSANSRFQPGNPVSLSRLFSEEGGSIVETALMMPIFLMILIALFTFSIAIYQKFELAEALSVGGRYLAVDRGDNDPCATTASKIYAAGPGLSKTKLTLSFSLNGGTATGASCPGSSGQANANMVSGGSAQITASYPCVLSYYSAFGATFNTACTLHAQVTELVQ